MNPVNNPAPARAPRAPLGRRTVWALALAGLLTSASAAANDSLFNSDFSDLVTFELGEVDVQINGRAQYDALIDADVPDNQQTGGAWRRARIGARFSWEDWRAYTSYDLTGDGTWRDFAVHYRGWPVRIEAGRIQEPFGLAEQGSSKNTLFMERPSASSLGPDYGLGVAANYLGEGWAASAGVFTDEGGELAGDRPEQALTARITARPYRGEDDRMVHVGAGYSSRKTADPEGLRISGSAETILVDGFTPRSPRVATEDAYDVAGVELALRAQGLLFQSEFVNASGDGDIGGSAYYAELGWVLTGERRDYSTRYGAFSGVEPKRPVFGGKRNGFGAFELGARYSATDLSDGGGDKGSAAGLALNWYPHTQLKASLNVQRLTIEPSTGPEEDTTLVQVRAQAFF